MRRRLDPARLESRVRAFARLRLLVVGDLVLDEYVWGDALRISPEAPVPVVRVRDEGVELGGAANVARNVLALGGQVALCSVVGDDAAGRRAAAMLGELGVDPKGLVTAEGRPTTRKTRVVARGQQLLRFDREEQEPPGRAVGRRLLAAIDEVLPGVDGVVVADYGKGAFSRGIAGAAMRRFRSAGLAAVVDPKHDLAACRGASLLKPNLREAESLSGIAIRGAGDLARAAARLRQRIGGGAVAVTRGAAGMVLFDEREPGTEVPTVAREVFDVQGAGDSTVAALALALRAGAALFEAAVIANAAAGVVVEKVGTATASAEEVCRRLPGAVAAAQGAP